MRSPKEQLIIDTEFDSIGDQLSIDNWTGAIIISGIALFFFGILVFVINGLNNYISI